MAAASAVGATPRVEYSSSVGVLGCKINIDLVAYWPKPVERDRFCAKLTTDKGNLNVLQLRRPSPASVALLGGHLPAPLAVLLSGLTVVSSVFVSAPNLPVYGTNTYSTLASRLS
jgi:hypothetical protein